jgi:hypothetical protein
VNYVCASVSLGHLIFCTYIGGCGSSSPCSSATFISARVLDRRTARTCCGPKVDDEAKKDDSERGEVQPVRAVVEEE